MDPEQEGPEDEEVNMDPAYEGEDQEGNGVEDLPIRVPRGVEHRVVRNPPL